ncbi:MAG: hypothetical protein ACK5LX_04980 [Oscillospiraceae bacterium]
MKKLQNRLAPLREEKVLPLAPCPCCRKQGRMTLFRVRETLPFSLPSPLPVRHRFFAACPSCAAVVAVSPKEAKRLLNEQNGVIRPESCRILRK